MEYDISALKGDINQFENDIDYYKKLCKELEEKNRTLKENLDVLETKHRQRYDKISNENQILKEAYKDLKEKFNKEIDKDIKLANALKENSELLLDLKDSFAAVTHGVFAQDSVEFAVLKTYRGWKYIYLDGKPYTDFENIIGVSADWSVGEKIKMFIERKQS